MIYNKKKVLFIVPRFTFGGTVFSTLNMLSFLSKCNLDIYILGMTHQGPVKDLYGAYNILPEYFILSALSGDYKNEKRFRKISFFFIEGLNLFLKKMGYNIERRIYSNLAQKIQNKEKFDIVASCQEGGATYFASYFNVSKKYAWYRTEYSHYKNQISTIDLEYEQHCYALFDKVVCVSKTTRDDFVKYFQGIGEKVIAIHNIQNTDNIISKSQEDIDDQRFVTDDFKIVSVGRIAPPKQFPSIPEIAYKLKQRGAIFIWFIIGDGNVDGQYDQLKENISKFKVDDCVKCLGSKINPYPYISKADLIVNTSSYEACPRVVIEAKILKTPVVCADFSYANEFVTNSYDGYVDRIDNLDEHIFTLIHSKEEYSRIKQNCDKYVIDNETIFKQLSDLFLA